MCVCRGAREVRGALGVLPVDYADPEALIARVRELAARGVDAVFDNIGGDTLTRSWSLLARGGTLVSYAIASALRERGSVVVIFLGLVARLAWWQLLPNGRRATFYDVWSGSAHRSGSFRLHLREDLGAVLALLSRGDIKARVAARFPLAEVAAAMELAESRTVYGKVVLQP